MKRILIFVAEFGDGSVHPCGKDMYELAQRLAQSGETDVTVLTARHNSSRVPTGVSVVELNTISDYREHWVKRFLSSKRGVKKFLYRTKLHFLDRHIRKKSVRTSMIRFKDFQKWLKVNRDSFDVLISVSYPFYIQEYAWRLKSYFKEKRWITYLLDPYADNQDCSMQERVGRLKKEKKLFKQCTNIFTVEEIASQAKYSPINEFKNKIQYIPTHLISDNTHYHKNNETEFVHFVYTGLFYPDIRNPEKLLQYFTKLPNNYILHLYSRGCASIIVKYKEILGDRLQVNGYILDEEKYNQMIGQADFLVDVGNTVSNQVPSKILTYCSFGKPIIHFKNCETEIIGDKFSKYSLFSVIDYAEDVDRVVKEIEKVVKRNFGNIISYQEIQDHFSDCTVEAIAEKVNNIIYQDDKKNLS